MRFLKNYTTNFVKYDLLLKFNDYKKISQIPKLKKIILSYEFKKYDFKLLLSSMVALELITSQKSNIIKSKVSNITLKIRKGNPTGCKVTLRKKLMDSFFFRLLNELLYKIQEIELNLNKIESTLITHENNKSKTFSFQVKKGLIFTELEYNYQIFKFLPDLNINIITNTKNYKELFMILKLYKIIIKSKCNSTGRV
jgi:large subunit ribosomal protein L5